MELQLQLLVNFNLAPAALRTDCQMDESLRIGYCMISALLPFQALEAGSRGDAKGYSRTVSAGKSYIDK